MLTAVLGSKGSRVRSSVLGTALGAGVHTSSSLLSALCLSSVSGQGVSEVLHSCTLDLKDSPARLKPLCEQICDVS